MGAGHFLYKVFSPCNMVGRWAVYWRFGGLDESIAHLHCQVTAFKEQQCRHQEDGRQSDKHTSMPGIKPVV